MNDDFRDLGRDMARAQDAKARPIDMGALKDALRAHAGPPGAAGARGEGKARGSWRRRWAYVGVPLAAVAAVAALAFALRTPEGPLEFRVGGAAATAQVGAQLAAPGETTVPVDFSDGSRVLLHQGASARVTAVGKAEAQMIVERGRGSFRIVPRRDNRWQIGLGPFRIQVKGTQFDADWNPEAERLIVELYEGSVLVTGCGLGEGRMVRAGETLNTSCVAPRREVGSADPEAPAPERAPAAAASEARAANGSSSPGALQPEALFRNLIRDGKYEAAFGVLDEAQIDALCQRGRSNDVLAIGNAARFTGRLPQAIRAFETVRRRFPRSLDASLAAYNLARVLSDKVGDHAAAARWFQTYVEERPDGELAREAQGRLFEALDRAGDRGAAQREARRYLGRYPDGPHAALAKQLAR